MLASLRAFFDPTVQAIKSHQVKIVVLLLVGASAGASAAYPSNPVVVQLAKAVLTIAALLGG